VKGAALHYIAVRLVGSDTVRVLEPYSNRNAERGHFYGKQRQVSRTHLNEMIQ